MKRVQTSKNRFICIVAKKFLKEAKMNYELMSSVLRKKVGSCTKKLILAIIAKNTKDGYCTMSLESIAEEAEMSRDAVWRNIKQLEQDNFLAVLRNSGEKNRYVVRGVK